MAFDSKKFKRVMHDSGLTMSELAWLYGVSRQSLYNWGDRAPGQKTLAARAEAYTNALVAALDKGVLPFSASKEADRKALLVAMAKRLHALTAPK